MVKSIGENAMFTIYFIHVNLIALNFPDVIFQPILSVKHFYLIFGYNNYTTTHTTGVSLDSDVFVWPKTLHWSRMMVPQVCLFINLLLTEIAHHTMYTPMGIWSPVPKLRPSLVLQTPWTQHESILWEFSQYQHWKVRK